MSSVHAGHRQRMRQRFAETGLNGFQEHEILEMLLFYVIPRRNTNPLAHCLLNTFGSIRNVMQASDRELRSIDGVNDQVISMLRFIYAFMMRYADEEESIDSMASYDEACRFFERELRGKRHEMLQVAFLDKKLRLMRVEVLVEGSGDSIQIPTKLLIERCVEIGSSTIILAHNHPNGAADASSEDIAATHRLMDILDHAGIRLIDHVIVGRRSVISMKETGLLI